MKAQLSQYPLTAQYPVHWGEMDSANHVNNLIYLRWAESSRIMYFRAMEIDTSFKNEAGPILGWLDCKYIFPITYPDTVIVSIRTIEILQDRFTLETALFSEKHQRISAISKQQIIPYSYVDLKKIPLPESWIAGIEKIEGKTF